MGILKKLGSKKHNRHVSFGKEYYSTGENPQNVKDWDGMSAESRAWYNFIDLTIILGIAPQIAWSRVPQRFLDSVWSTLIDVLDKYAINGRFISMPKGTRYYFTVGEQDYFCMNKLGKWVQNIIIQQNYRNNCFDYCDDSCDNYCDDSRDNLEKSNKCQGCGSTFIVYDKIFKVKNCSSCGAQQMSDEEEEQEQEQWIQLKENHKRKKDPYNDILILETALGNIEI